MHNRITALPGIVDNFALSDGLIVLFHILSSRILKE